MLKPEWSWTSWHPHPDVWALCIVLVVGYVLLVRRVGPSRVSVGESLVTRAQIRNFALSITLLFISAEWPMHDLSEGYLYSAHMTQHMILTLAVAPLLMAGIPAWMARTLVPPRAMRVARTLARPLIALAIFNTYLVFSHWPRVVEAAVGDEVTHFVLHSVLVLSALIMWAPVLSPVLEVPRLSYPGQIGYLFLQSLVPTVPASFLTFGSAPLYKVYALFPHPWGISTLSDQRAAGLLMKIGGGFAIWGVITVLFFKWQKQEIDTGVDALGLRDVDATLNRMELTS